MAVRYSARAKWLPGRGCVAVSARVNRARNRCTCTRDSRFPIAARLAVPAALREETAGPARRGAESWLATLIVGLSLRLAKAREALAPQSRQTSRTSKARYCQQPSSLSRSSRRARDLIPASPLIFRGKLSEIQGLPSAEHAVSGIEIVSHSRTAARKGEM